MTKSEMIEAIHENNKELRNEIKSWRNEARADRRWMIGLFISAIIAIPALIRLLEFIH